MGRNRYQTIDREEFEHVLRQQEPDNEHRSVGYALVNVLDPEQYAKQHIPGSINIPRNRIDVFENLFDKNKGIILYCASADCQASLDAVEALAKRGFTNVRDYEEGMSGWKGAGNPVEGREAA